MHDLRPCWIIATQNEVFPLVKCSLFEDMRKNEFYILVPSDLDIKSDPLVTLVQRCFE